MDPIIPEERLREMRHTKLWPDRLVTDYLDEAVAQRPDQVAIVDHNSMSGRSTTLSYRQLARRVDRMALGLAALGVEPGDVVAFQLPNWWQFTALYLACARIGAVANPMMHIFRHRELRFMLGFAEAKVVVVPRQFRGFNYPQMVEELRGELPALRHVLVIEERPEGSFEEALLTRRWEDEQDGPALFAKRRAGPNDVTQLQYTSGTTGEPKGVMHTPNTLLGNLLSIIGVLGMTGQDVMLMGSPLAHQTGFLYGMLMPIVLGTKSVLMDIWNPAEAATLIQDEGATFTMGSTPFVADLTDSPMAEQRDLSTLHVFVTAGAPIPRVLVQRARERLGAHIVSAWGMTENGAATCARLDDPPEKVFETDGAPIPGMEVRVVDGEGRPLPPGEEGRLQARGMCNFVGYLKRPDRFDTDAEGWFNTGDLARMDKDGYIRISGRAKDILIRGGENVPVVEVEGVLYRHPAIQDVAIVGMPDERLGERGCAFVTLREGQALTLPEMVSFLESERMARQYFPERLEVLPEMPRTASGKIQKFRLREMATGLKPDAV
ncbi:MAG TPA: cyclohexanecarboxylate-CoA ligase [bacterium]|nr:cyclohexanecarboxylate-CoA ligase [bacterium]